MPTMPFCLLASVVKSLRSGLGWSLAVATIVLVVGCESTNVIPVTATTVTVEPDQPVMLVGQVETFSATPRAAGGERLTGRAVEWTSGDPDRASVTANGQVTARAEGPVTISATIEGVMGSSAVTVEAGPEIRLDEFFVLFQSELGNEVPQPVHVAITNEGNGRVEGLRHLIRYGQGSAGAWLAETTLSSTRAPATLSVRANPGSLPEGEYTAEVEIRSSSAINSPQVLSVTLAVGQALPSIQLSLTSVAVPIPRLFPNPVALSLIGIANGGGGQLQGLELEVEYDGGGQEWLAANLDAASAPTSLRMAARAGTLQVGVYRAVVTISSPGAAMDREVSVTLTIT